MPSRRAGLPRGGCRPCRAAPSGALCCISLRPLAVPFNSRRAGALRGSRLGLQQREQREGGNIRRGARAAVGKSTRLWPAAVWMARSCFSAPSHLDGSTAQLDPVKHSIQRPAQSQSAATAAVAAQLRRRAMGPCGRRERRRVQRHVDTALRAWDAAGAPAAAAAAAEQNAGLSDPHMPLSWLTWALNQNNWPVTNVGASPEGCNCSGGLEGLGGKARARKLLGLKARVGFSGSRSSRPLADAMLKPASPSASAAGAAPARRSSAKPLACKQHAGLIVSRAGAT